MSATRALQARLDELSRSPAYEAYRRARDGVLRMRELAPEPHAPSEYWRDELAGFEYMLDASPLVVEKLRQHTFHVTGVRPYEYRAGKDEGRVLLAEKLGALLELGDESYLVPESPVLGGFGHQIDGALYNIDTLKFFEVLIALDRGAVLQELRTADERRLVWEIGAGWGGFAYQLKTVCPQTTYLIVDLPELFLFSATYLQAVFPGCRLRMWAGQAPEELFDGWEGLDFILVPHTAMEAVRPPRLDVVVNMVSFQEMTTEQVTAYVDHAYDCGAPYLYSLNRDRSVYNRELSSVREIIARRYWVHQIPVLDVPYGKHLNSSPSRNRRAALSSRIGKASAAISGNVPVRDDYKHVIGWRKLG